MDKFDGELVDLLGRMIKASEETDPCNIQADVGEKVLQILSNLIEDLQEA